MTENSSRNRDTAADSGTGVAESSRRKLEVRRETVKDLTPETRSAGKIKGGIPEQTKNVAGPNFNRDY